MKKYLFILLLTIAGYGQTYQNPTFGTIKTKTAPTVTSTSYLGAISATGVVGKIVPTSDILTNESTVTGLTTTEALNNLNTALGTNNIATAYVEKNGNDATAQIGNSRKAYLTIDAALDALPLTGGVVRIGIGTFNSPNRLKIKDNTKFVGSGKPYPNMTISYASQGVKPTISSPTKLVGGTILQGEFNFTEKNFIEVHNLGVDVGKEWIDTHGGVAVNGLRHSANAVGSNDLNNNLAPPSKGIVVKNVSSLNYDTNALTHAVLIENVVDANIDGISTYYATHGTVIKGKGINLSNVNAFGHSSNGVVIKADIYAYCSDVNVSNVYITSIGNYDGGGFRLVSSTGGMLKNVNVSNINIEHTKFGIKDDNEGVDGANLNNINISDVQDNGISFSEFSKRVIINNAVIDGCGLNGVNLISKATTNDQTITNCVIKNAVYNGAYFYAVGGLIYASNINVIGAVAIDGGATSNVRGFNVRSSGFFTGALVYDVTLNNEYISTIDSKGKINKSLVKVSSTGLVEFPVTPTAPTPTAGDNDTSIATTAFVTSNATSGSYMPTLTNIANTTSLSNIMATYIKIGSLVTVYVGVQVTPTVSATTTRFSITLPINRATSPMAGLVTGYGTLDSSGGVKAYYSALVKTLATTTTVEVRYVPTTTGTSDANFSFQYSVL